MLVPSPLEDILRAKRRQLLALRGRIKRGGEFDTLNHYEAVAREIQAEVEESPDCGGGEQQVLVVGIVGPCLDPLFFFCVCLFVPLGGMCPFCLKPLGRLRLQRSLHKMHDVPSRMSETKPDANADTGSTKTCDVSCSTSEWKTKASSARRNKQKFGCLAKLGMLAWELCGGS